MGSQAPPVGACGPETESIYQAPVWRPGVPITNDDIINEINEQVYIRGLTDAALLDETIDKNLSMAEKRAKIAQLLQLRQPAAEAPQGDASSFRPGSRQAQECQQYNIGTPAQEAQESSATPRQGPEVHDMAAEDTTDGVFASCEEEHDPW